MLFGGNWNALRVVLGDLGWLPGTAYVLVVEDADQLLADAPEALDADLRVLTAAAENADATGRVCRGAAPQPSVDRGRPSRGASRP